MAKKREECRMIPRSLELDSQVLPSHLLSEFNMGKGLVLVAARPSKMNDGLDLF